MVANDNRYVSNWQPVISNAVNFYPIFSGWSTTQIGRSGAICLNNLVLVTQILPSAHRPLKQIAILKTI